MLPYLASNLVQYFGPLRLLVSNAMLICFALYSGFLLTLFLLPKCYKFLPQDRGREFTISAELAKGKPTGAGVVFISIFVIIAFLFTRVTLLQACIIILTWLTMLTGFLDDKSAHGWGEYRKALLDLAICVLAALALYFLKDGLGATATSVATASANIGASSASFATTSTVAPVYFWLPFYAKTVAVHPVLFIALSVVILWTSINTTNCTDGVDGLSSTLVLIGLGVIGFILYFVLGHRNISEYLLVPHLQQGAQWGIITFALCGVLLGYLWHNAFPSKVLMGDAGSRALGFFIGCMVIVSRNPFLLLATSSIILVNGGMGLLKVALLRFFNIRIFSNVRFPLHDHMRKNCNWSPTQVLLKFMILQLLISAAVLGIIFKVR